MGARVEEFSEDSIIVKEGDSLRRMYVVLEGKVILYSNYNTENEYIIGACSKGHAFGELSLFTDTPYKYTAVAYNDAKVAWFEKNNLDSFIKGYPDYAMHLFETISKSFMLLYKDLEMAMDEINYLRQLNANSAENTVINTSSSKTTDAAKPSEDSTQSSAKDSVPLSFEVPTPIGTTDSDISTSAAPAPSSTLDYETVREELAKSVYGMGEYHIKRNK